MAFAFVENHFEFAFIFGCWFTVSFIYFVVLVCILISLPLPILLLFFYLTPHPIVHFLHHCPYLLPPILVVSVAYQALEQTLHSHNICFRFTVS